jgi:WD40 repeat protein
LRKQMKSLDPFKYWAFISYSHTDSVTARKVHGYLENYKLPLKVVSEKNPGLGNFPEKLFPIFLDREEISGASSLSTEIRRALDYSHSLIVLCSKTTPYSIWVKEEISYFRSKHPSRSILPVILDGEPFSANPELECIPSGLKDVNTKKNSSPLSASDLVCCDTRTHADGFKYAMLKLVAGITDIGLSDLTNRDAQRKTRQTRLYFLSLLTVIAITSALAFWAVFERNEATMQRSVAERNSADATHQKEVAEAQTKSARRAEQRAETKRIEAEEQREEAKKQQGIAIRKQEIISQQNFESGVQAAVALTKVASEASEQNHLDRAIRFAVLAAKATKDNLSNLAALYSLQEVMKKNIKAFDLLGHAGRVASIVFVGQGEALLTTSDDKTAILWNLRSKAAMATFRHDAAVLFSASNDVTRRLVTATKHTVSVWSYPRGSLQFPHHKTVDIISGVSFSADGKFILIKLAGSFGTSGLAYTVLDSQTGEIKVSTDDSGEGSHFYFAHGFVPNSNYLLVIHDEKDLWIVGLDSGRISRRLTHSKQEIIEKVETSPSGQLIAVFYKNGERRIWDFQKNKFSFDLEIGQSLKFTPNNRLISCGKLDGCKLIDLSTSKKILTIDGMESPIELAKFSENGSVFLAVKGNRVKFFKTDDYRVIGSSSGYEIGPYSDISFVSGEGTVLSSGAGELVVWAVGTDRNSARKLRHDSAIASFSVSADLPFVATGSNEGSVSVWQAEKNPLKVIEMNTDPTFLSTLNQATRQPLFVFGTAGTAQKNSTNGHYAQIVSATGLGNQKYEFPDSQGFLFARISTEGGHLVMTSFDRVGVWELKSNRMIVDVKVDPPPNERAYHLMTAHISPSGDKFVTTWGPDVKVWDTQTGQKLKSMVTQTNGSRPAFFNADGSRVITHTETTLSIWDYSNRESKARSLRSFALDVSYGLSLSPDGLYLLSRSNVNNHASLRKFSDITKSLLDIRHEDRVSDSDFSSDSRFLVTASHDGIAKMWDLKNVNYPPSIFQAGGKIDFIKFSLDSELLLIQTYRSLQIWDRATGVKRDELFLEPDSMLRGYLSANNRTIVVHSRDVGIVLWKPDLSKIDSVDEYLKQSCKRLSIETRRIVSKDILLAPIIPKRQIGQPVC